MSKLQLVLDRADAMQILDALRSRRECWQHTAEYLLGNGPVDEFVIIEDCSHVGEAEGIVQHYSDIIASIESQL